MAKNAKKIVVKILGIICLALVFSVLSWRGTDLLKPTQLGPTNPNYSQQVDTNLSIDSNLNIDKYVIANGKVYQYAQPKAQQQTTNSHTNISLQAHAQTLNINNIQNFQLIFLQDSVTALSAVAVENNIASILTINNQGANVAITMQYPHSTAYGQSSLDAQYTLGEMATNSSTKLTYTNGEFVVGETRGSTSLTAATSSSEAKIIHVRNGHFKLSGNTIFDAKGANCRALLQTGGTLTLDGPTITGFALVDENADYYGGSVLHITNGTFNFNSGVIGSSEETIATEEDFANGGLSVIVAQPDSETADVTVNLNGGIIGRNNGEGGNTFCFYGYNEDGLDMHLNMLGTTIQYNYTDYGDCLIYPDYYCETVLDGSVIKYNQTPGSLFWDEEGGSTFTMHSGEISNNFIEGTLLAISKGLNITGGTIKNNECYGISYCHIWDENGYCNISGLTLTNNDCSGDMITTGSSLEKNITISFSDSIIQNNTVGGSIFYSEGAYHTTILESLTFADNYCESYVLYPGGADVVLSNIISNGNTVGWEFLYTEMIVDSLTIRDTFSVTNNNVLYGVTEYDCYTIYLDSGADIYLQGDITLDCTNCYGAIGGRGNIYLQTNKLNFINTNHNEYTTDIGIENSDLLVYLQAQLTNQLKIYKHGLTSFDAGDTVSSYIAYSANTSYLASAQQHITIANLIGKSTVPSSAEKANYLVCTPTFATGLFDAETGEQTHSWLELLNSDMITVSNGVLTGNDDSMAGKLVISPSVSIIGDSAFGDYPSLTEVIIPNNVETIGRYAFGCCESITNITIGDSVITIGDSAFTDCYRLTSVTIPDSVTSIGHDAFYYCEVMTSLTIGNSVVTIGDSAFSDCYGLTSVTIPDSVTSIGDYAFAWCDSLINIYIPSNVENIGEAAFGGCAVLTSIIVDTSNTTYHSSGNCLIETATKTLIAGCNTSIIPDYITSIGKYAFSGCSGLTGELIIPDSVTSIGSYAFNGCSGLTGELVIPDSVTSSIGQYAFSYCSGLTSVTIGSGVTSIGYSAFGHCSGLTGELIIPNSVTGIGGSAFSYCSGLTSVTIGNGVTSIGNSAFRGCIGLTSVTIGNGVTSIDNFVFSDCSGLTSVTIPDSVMSIGSEAFYRCSGLTSITIGSEVTSIGNYAFSECTKVQTLIYNGKVSNNFTISSNVFRSLGTNSATGKCEVIIGDNVTTIPAYMFYATSSTPNGITSVSIGNSVKTIGKYAFDGCTGVQQLIYNGNVTTSLSGVFGEIGETSATGACEVIIGDNVTTIPAYMFYATSSTPNGITSVSIGNSVKTIGNYAFYNCSGLTGELVIPNSVTSIGSHAFYNCSGLTGELIIPNSVTSIGDYAFFYCSGLTGELIIPNSVTSIGDDAFFYCSGLTGELIIPNSVTSIGDDAFYNCRGLTRVTIGNGVTSIGNSAFYICINVLEYDFTGHTLVPTLGTNAFLGINSNCKIYVPSYLYNTWVAATNWSTWADYIVGVEVPGLYNQTTGDIIYTWKQLLSNNKITVTNGALKGNDSTMAGRLVIDDSVTSIAMNGFQNYTGLTSVSFPEGLITIGGLAFMGCTNLSGNLILPSTLKTIEKRAFQGCSKLTGELRLPSGLTRLERSAFQTCSGFTGSLVIPDGITEIGAYTFSNCKGLNGTLTLSNGLISVGEYAFTAANFTGELILPNTLTTIGTYAFCGVDCVGTLVLPDSVTSLGEYAFSDCSGFTGLKLSKNLTNLQSFAFAFCKNLAGDLVIPEGLTTIGINVFRYNKFTNVYFPSTITSIGQYAFSESSLDVLYDFTACTSIPTIGIGEFDGADKAFKIHVPSYLYNDWVAATNWSTWADHIEAELPAGLYDASGKSTYTWQELLDNEMIKVENGVLYGNDPFMVGKLVISDTVTSIFSYTFQNYVGLTSISIPNSVTGIGIAAFRGCSGLTRINIGNGVTSIGDEAFYGCSGVQILTYNSNVTTVITSSSNVFRSLGTNSATGTCKVIIGGNVTTIREYMFYASTVWPNRITSVTIGNSVTSIGDAAFYNCGGLTSITIPSSVTSIGDEAFYGCSSLTSIFIPSSVTTISANSSYSSPFYNCSSSMVIYCEASSKPSGWGTYWNYYSSSSTLTTYYGCTRDEAGNIYLADGTLAVAVTATTSTAAANLTGTSVAYANLNLTSNYTVAYIKAKEEDGDQPEAILNKDDYDTDTPPVINQTTSV